jgi:hypothetical protein
MRDSASSHSLARPRLRGPTYGPVAICYRDTIAWRLRRQAFHDQSRKGHESAAPVGAVQLPCRRGGIGLRCGCQRHPEWIGRQSEPGHGWRGKVAGGTLFGDDVTDARPTPEIEHVVGGSDLVHVDLGHHRRTHRGHRRRLRARRYAAPRRVAGRGVRPRDNGHLVRMRTVTVARFVGNCTRHSNLS